MNPMNLMGDEMLRNWLLHKLPADQAQSLEQRLLQDEAFGLHLQAVETDLLDDYARDRLSAADRTAAANHLLATPRDRERLRFAAALARSGAAQETSARTAAHRHSLHSQSAPWSKRRRRVLAGGALASACAVLIAVVGLNRYGGTEAPSVAAQAIMTITLADPQRGAPIAEINIPHGTAKIRLQVEVDSAAPPTRYRLNIADGAHTVFSAQNLVAREAAPYRYVEAMVPASHLRDGEHRVDVAVQGAATGATTWSIHTRDE